MFGVQAPRHIGGCELFPELDVLHGGQYPVVAGFQECGRLLNRCERKNALRVAGAKSGGHATACALRFSGDLLQKTLIVDVATV